MKTLLAAVVFVFFACLVAWIQGCTYDGRVGDNPPLTVEEEGIKPFTATWVAKGKFCSLRGKYYDPFLNRCVDDPVDIDIYPVE